MKIIIFSIAWLFITLSSTSCIVVFNRNVEPVIEPSELKLATSGLEGRKVSVWIAKDPKLAKIRNLLQKRSRDVLQLTSKEDNAQFKVLYDDSYSYRHASNLTVPLSIIVPMKVPHHKEMSIKIIRKANCDEPLVLKASDQASLWLHSLLLPIMPLQRLWYYIDKGEFNPSYIDESLADQIIVTIVKLKEQNCNVPARILR